MGSSLSGGGGGGKGHARSAAGYRDESLPPRGFTALIRLQEHYRVGSRAREHTQTHTETCTRAGISLLIAGWREEGEGGVLTVSPGM